jgi:pyruvate dehydrogenase E1 component alpha subunit
LVEESQLKAIDKKIRTEIEECVRFAESSPEPDAKDLFRYQFAEDE